MHGDTEPTPREYADRRRAERRFDRRVLFPALAVSAILHFVLLFSFQVQPRSDRLAPAPVRYISDPVMRVHDVTAVDTEVAPFDDQVREEEQRRDITAPESPWTAAPPAGAPPPADGASVRDRLRYRMGSAEVWRPQPERRGELMTPDEVVRTRIAAELRQFNDSVAAEEARIARGREWAFTDSEGRRWGIAPDRLYLGKDTINIPFDIEFRPPPGRRDEIAARVRTWSEIQDQAARVQTQETIDARIRAIRERAEQQRNDSTPVPPRGPGGGTGT